MPAVSVVLPVRSDSGSFKSAVERIRSSLAEGGVECEIVAVLPEEVAAALGGAATEADRAVEHRGRAGLGAMVKTGVAAASHDLVAVVDPEAGYAIERLPTLVRAAERHAMVVGAATQSRGQVVRRLCEFATGSHIPDENSALRVFRKSEIGPYLPSLDAGSRFGTTATLAYLFDDRSVVHIPVEVAPAIGPRKNPPIGETLAGFQAIVETILRHAPLRLFLLVAAPFAILGLPATGFGFLLAFGARTFDWYVGTGLLGCAIFLAGVASVLAATMTVAMGMLATSLRDVRSAERAGQPLEFRSAGRRSNEAEAETVGA